MIAPEMNAKISIEVRSTGTELGSLVRDPDQGDRPEYMPTVGDALVSNGHDVKLHKLHLSNL